MPRWLQVTISLVLFAIVMLALRVVLHAWVPSLLSVLEATVGMGGAWALLAAVLAFCALVGFWPRMPDGRLRPLLPPRR